MKLKRSVRFVAALGALALVAAACGGGSDFEAGELGAVTVEAGEAIQIRSLQVITGPDAGLGIPEERAVRLAVTDYGNIAGHTVEVGTGLDDLCSADGGQAAAQTIVADDQVVGVIGTSCSGAATAAMPLVSDKGMVMISGSNTSPALTSDLLGTQGTDNHAGYYRTAHNDFIQGAAAANFLFGELGLTKVALIHDGDPYTNGLTNAMQAAFEELGGTITVHTAVAKDQTDMVPVLTEVAATAPEAIFFPLFVPATTAIVQQIGGVAGLEDIVLMGADAGLTDDVLVLPESAGMYFSGPDLRFGEAASETGTNAETFLAAYAAEYGEDPTAPFWGHAYDATVMLLSAIETVGVVDGDVLHIDRALLRNELSNTSGFAGITGTLSCDEFGDCASGKITVIEHLDPSDPDTSKANVVFGYVP
jgi:branched-chain amino acid transport system substrate-binding protein